ncbi:MAG: cytochrome c maturation protein CcmE [Alphaproteobacteria bacterium]|nr:cytochrome c maturation protein CcmE [Alphaproteobacteria bacterium]
MTRKRKRLYVVLGGMAILGLAAALVLSAFEDNLVFFYSPTDLDTKEIAADLRFRLGGLVEEASVERSSDGLTTTFRVTDLVQSVAVTYRGLLPDLFREGQGVVAEGRLDGNGVFVATQVLAKHDENYMPPEVAEALRKSGRWQGEGEQ